MLFLVYCSSGKDFDTFNYPVIKEFRTRYYFGKILEIPNLFDFKNKCKEDIVLQDIQDYLLDIDDEYPNDYINNNCSYAIEIYDYYRE